MTGRDTTRSRHRAGGHDGRSEAATVGGPGDGRAVRASRGVAFFLIAGAILAGGVYLAGNVFTAQRDQPTTADAVPMRISMAGFDPAVLEAEPGEVLTIEWWNTDGALHLEGGVHTLVSAELGIRYELPAQSRRTITLAAPTEPGDYDFWCDSCCGGEASPSMHATLRVTV
ncbi:MAG: cupredoxin domain-containing protein [Candidatus Limnocylindrales bacterium]